MTYTHVSTPRTTAVAGAGAVALITAVLTVPSADAATGQPPDPPSATLAAQRAEEIRTTLGGEEAGSYYDAENRKLVVNVTSEAAAAKVRAAGAQARIVKHSLASLDAARATLKEQAAIPGTSWAMDPRINKVVVVADPTVKGKHLDRLTTATASLGERVTLSHSPHELRPVIAGGDAIWGSQARCSLGFNVVKDGQPYVLTAGHCAKAVQRWSEQMGGSEIAVTENHKFPGADFGLAKYTAADVVHPSAVNLYSSQGKHSSGGDDGGGGSGGGGGGGNMQTITKAADPIVGQKVRRSGSTTHVRDGEVTALNVTANYQEGPVEGLIQTTVCAEPGDSGGPLFDGDTALGLTSGGRGSCSQKGETFYQPVRAALEKTGAKLG